jgi:hypothetical protein
VSSKLLEERQAEMRERLARDKKSKNQLPMPVEGKAAVTEVDNEPPHEPTIVKQQNGSSTVSREDLYRLIWSEPVIKVASRLGVSDVAVAKACRKQDTIAWARLLGVYSSRPKNAEISAAYE